MSYRLDELLKLEHAGWRSLCDGTGSDLYGGVMTADARMVLANGAVMDREEVIASLDEAPPWDGYDIDDPSLLAVSPDVVSLVYSGTGRRDDGDDFTGIMASTYRREGSDWRLALYQQTPTPARAAHEHHQQDVPDRHRNLHRCDAVLHAVLLVGTGSVDDRSDCPEREPGTDQRRSGRTGRPPQASRHRKRPCARCV